MCGVQTLKNLMAKKKTSTAVVSSELVRRLAPCPWCGKTEDDMDKETGQHAIIATTFMPSKSCVVQCNWCGLSGPIFRTIEYAIKTWNALPRKTPNESKLSHGGGES